MKKTIALFLSLALCLSMAAGCGSRQNVVLKNEADTGSTEDISEGNGQMKENQPEQDAGEAVGTEETVSAEEAASAEETTLRVTALKGPTAMGLVRLMEESDNGPVNGNSYDFNIVASVDEVTPKLVQGETDIAAVPANLASVLYNSTNGGVQVLAVNTLGVLYIAETGDSIQSVSDLKGKTIYASGKGATPEYALNYILSSNGLDVNSDVTIEWKSEHSECVAALAASGNGAVALLPQPFVTTAQMKNDKIRVALDLNTEWDKLQEGTQAPSALLTGVVVVRTAFAQENPEAVNAFLDSYKESVEYVNANTADAAALIEKYDIVMAAVAKQALPYCNIVFIEGTEMKEKLSGYLNVLMEQNEKSVGGASPADDFYYSR